MVHHLGSLAEEHPLEDWEVVGSIIQSTMKMAAIVTLFRAKVSGGF